MLKIRRKYTEAKIYSETAEEYAIAQVKMICDNETAVGSKICMMPDIHPGKVGPVGLTMTVGEKILPNLIGADMGCGMSYNKIKNGKTEFQKLDKVIREKIPTGSNIRREPHRLSDDFEFQVLDCCKHINENKALLSLGTLAVGITLLKWAKTNRKIYM